MAGINDALVDHDIDLDSEEETVESLKAHIAKHFSKDPPLHFESDFSGSLNVKSHFVFLFLSCHLSLVDS